MQEQKIPVDVLVLGLQFVDTHGNRDLVYDMGRPTTRKEQFDPEIMKEMMAGLGGKQQASQSLSDAAETQVKEQADKIAAQDALIEEMRQEQSKTNDMMAALLLEMKAQRQPATTKETKTTRRRK